MYMCMYVVLLRTTTILVREGLVPSGVFVCVHVCLCVHVCVCARAHVPQG